MPAVHIMNESYDFKTSRILRWKLNLVPSVLILFIIIMKGKPGSILIFDVNTLDLIYIYIVFITLIFEHVVKPVEIYIHDDDEKNYSEKFWLTESKGALS